MLTLFTLALIYGCSHNNSSAINSQVHSSQEIKITRNISKIESEMYTELKSIDGAYYRSILGSATNDEEITIYGNVNLLSVKIICDMHICKIKLFYDKSLLNVSVFENFSEPIYSTAYRLAFKHKLNNPEVEIYVNNKPFR